MRKKQSDRRMNRTIPKIYPRFSRAFCILDKNQRTVLARINEAGGTRSGVAAAESALQTALEKGDVKPNASVFNGILWVK